MSDKEWRVGTRVPVNVYEGERPICQCHTALDARRIVEAVNAAHRELGVWHGPGVPEPQTVFNHDQIKYMVNRFLAWKLPENFNPDAGISFRPSYNERTEHPMRHEPVGTNLFDATQAEEMIRYLVDGTPPRGSAPAQSPEDFWEIWAKAHAKDAALMSSPDRWFKFAKDYAASRGRTEQAPGSSDELEGYRKQLALIHLEMCIQRERADAAEAKLATDVKTHLCQHWLTEVHCNHEQQTDEALCFCGWRSSPWPSVAQAVSAWAEHIAVEMITPHGRPGQGSADRVAPQGTPPSPGKWMLRAAKVIDKKVLRYDTTEIEADPIGWLVGVMTACSESEILPDKCPTCGSSDPEKYNWSSVCGDPLKRDSWHSSVATQKEK